MTSHVDHKIVLVTGGGSGIGQATATLFAERGATVRIGDVDEAGMAVTCAASPAITARRVDVAEESSVAAFVEGAVADLGGLDVVVNLAGVLGFANTHEMPLEAWRRIIDVNLTGTFLVCRAALPHLLDGGGVIVNTASTSAHIGQPWAAAYGASKGGILAMTRTLAVEYGRRGVRANTVSPGGIDTPMTGAFAFPEGADRSLLPRTMPLGDMGTVSDVAETIVFLSSDGAGYLNGSDIRVDGATTA
jgi:NAD(P)-dependent dehydrogenase (short-subunit alcohol dehydrogenase family)